MKLKEIRSKSDAELREAWGSLRRESYTLRVQASVGQLKNPSRIRRSRREAAQILTVLGERARASGGKGKP